MKRKKRLLAAAVGLALATTTWLVVNPLDRFGWCCFGYSTFAGCPRFVVDFQVRADGSSRQVTKTHQLSFQAIEWLMEPQPEVLIIALGWDGLTNPDETIREYTGCEVYLLKNREAIELFNRLKSSGSRVAIHYHSTC